MKIMRQLFIALLLFISIEGFGQVSVTATAGTATGSYATLNAAFAAINAGTHQGAINISITANTTEPSPPTSLVGNGVGSASYTSINISPSGGSWTVNSSAVPFAYRGIIELFGAQHVTIDGDPTGTGSRNLTFEMTMTSNLSTSSIRFGSTATTAISSPSYDTVRNCNIIGGRDSVNTLATDYGILFSGNNTGSVSTPVAYGCSYNSFVNNTFSRCYYGIYLIGSGDTSLAGNNNTLIRKNYFLGSSADTSNNYGVYMTNYNVDYSQVLGIIDSNDFTATGNFNFCGIYNFNSGGQLTIDNNNIHDANGPQVQGYYSQWRDSTYAPLDFYNNTFQNCVVNDIYESCLFCSSTVFLPSFPAKGKMDIHDNIVNNISGQQISGITIRCQSDSAFCHNNRVTNLSEINANIGANSDVTGISGGIIYNNIITNLSSADGTAWGIAYGQVIYNNIISGISSTDVNSNAYGIAINGSIVFNNMISDITAAPQLTSGTTSTAIGIYNYTITGNSLVYGNTIALNTSNQSGTVSNAFSTGIYDYNGYTRYQDNIIYNSQNSTNAYGFYGNDAGTFSLDTLDYNEYYIPQGIIGFTGAAPEATLLDWQAATGQDFHSVSGQVPFISTTNLHIDTLNAAANNVFRNGTYLTSVSTDIDGQTRNNPPCIGADEFYAVNALPDSLVWPGDADNNRVVDNNDLLPIGLGYDSTGPVRTVTGIVWQADVANNWANYFTIYSPTVNFNHADCNGDGIINANDTAAIAVNYGDIHSKTNNLPGPWRSGIPPLYVKISQDTVYNDSILITNIYLGDSTTPVSNIYGLAFTFNYDPLVIDSNYSSFSFIPSWLGTSANSININRNFATGQVQAAITGIDHLSRSGNGQIATFRGVITTDNINAKNWLYYHNLNYISDITAIDQYGNPVPLNAGVDSNYVGYFINGIKPVSASATVSVYPNPAATQVRVSADMAINGITITDLLGEVIQTININGRKDDTVDISQLAAGVYTVHVSAAGGTATAKLVVSR